MSKPCHSFGYINYVKYKLAVFLLYLFVQLRAEIHLKFNRLILKVNVSTL